MCEVSFRNECYCNADRHWNNFFMDTLSVVLKNDRNWNKYERTKC